MFAHLHKILGILLLIGSLVAGWFVWDFRTYSSTPLDVDADGETFTVPPGTSLRQLARTLHDRGWMRNTQYFVWLARIEDATSRIRAGEYFVAPNTDPKALLQLLVSGPVVQHDLTLVEGWNFQEVMAAVGRHEAIAKTLNDRAPAAVMQQLGHGGMHHEGRFFPETYHFPRGTSDVEFLRRAFDQMEKELAEAWPSRAQDLPYETPYEALIMASIIEKETGLASERPEIAGVFVRRLRKGMLLQSDPTVIYGMGPQFDGNLRRRDLLTDTPYNTYTRAGLPPTPIANPGRASIEAALHPAAGNALYFVARGDGSHVFSATLAEHNAAVDRFQRKRRAK